MRYVSGNNFGSNKNTLLTLYKALIRSKIDYGCQIYQTATDNALQILNTIQAKALRIALGATRNTPNISLLAESGEWPLHLRREKLTLKYWARTQPLGLEFPPNKIIEEAKNYSYIFKERTKQHKKPPYNYLIREILEKHQLSDIKIEKQIVNPQIPWLAVEPETSTELLDKVNKKDNPLVANSIVQATIEEKYQNYTQIYTDGSKQNEKVGLGIYIPEFKVKISGRISNYTSIYTSELLAIQIALKTVELKQPDRVVILSDSLSSIQSIETNNSSRDDILKAIQLSITKIDQLGIDLKFEWIPSHINIKGNDIADQLAKDSLSHKEIDINIKLSPSEVYSLINKSLETVWTKQWLEIVNNELRNIQETPIKKVTMYSYDTYEDKIITRIRLGKTKLKSDRAQMIRTLDPNCIDCQIPETLHHVIFQCPNHQIHRNELREKLGKLEIPFTKIQDILTSQITNRQLAYRYLILFIKNIGYIKNI